MNVKLPRILFIAGSDSGGGAGIQADIKTATALGAYAMTAVTAVTAQDTTGVYAVELMPPALVAKQIKACLDDIGADAIKIGMLGSGKIAAAVAEALHEVARSVPVVLDPVLASTSGTPLLDEGGITILRERLIPLAKLVTPNIPEAELLTHRSCRDGDGIVRAGQAIIAMGAGAVLIKGGHGEGETVIDVLVTPTQTKEFAQPRIDTHHTHGTGCTFAAVVAVELARNIPLEDAVARAQRFTREAIETAPEFGRGRGPLNHMIGSDG